MESGDYTGPIFRTGWHKMHIVSGYTTGRLRATDLVNVANYEQQKTEILFSNPDSGQVKFKIQETGYASGGSRTDIGGEITVNPLGFKTTTIYPKAGFLEILGTGGPGTLRMQVVSQVKWDVMAFDKTEVRYPQDNLKAKLSPWPTNF